MGSHHVHFVVLQWCFSSSPFRRWQSSCSHVASGPAPTSLNFKPVPASSLAIEPQPKRKLCLWKTASAEAVFHRHSLRLGCGSMAREEAGTGLKFRLVGAGPEATCEQDDCHLRKGELEKHHWSTTKCTWWLPNQYRTRLQTMPLSQNLHETAVKKALRP